MWFSALKGHSGSWWWPAGTFRSAVCVFVWMMAACQQANEVEERADSAKAEGQSAKLNEKATKREQRG